MAPVPPSKMDRLVRLGVVYDGMPVCLKHKLPSYVRYDPDDPRFHGVLRIVEGGVAVVELADGSTRFVSGAAVDVFNAFKPGKPRRTAAGNEHWGTQEISFARWSEQLASEDPVSLLPGPKKRGDEGGQGPPKANVGKLKRNPPWTRDEVVLALELYRRIRFNTTSSDHPEVVALSDWLRKARLAPPADEENFRSPSAVYQKLANFGALDPDHPSTGLPHGSSLDRIVWEEFQDDRERLARVAATIRTMVNSFGPPEYAEGPEEAFEGMVLRRVHVRRERNPGLRKEAIRRHRKKHGNLSCQACGFDFEAIYGERGADTIQVHHTKPVADLKPDEATNVRDLALLCANCHFIVHRRRPMLSVEEVQALVRANGAAGSNPRGAQATRRPAP